MEPSQTCTGPKTQQSFEVSSNRQIFVHAQSATALPIWELEDTCMFVRWNFYQQNWRRPDPLIPKADFEDMVRRVIPDYDPETWILSVKEISKSKGYARPFTFERAMKSKESICGSEYHFVRDEHIWATTISSFNAVDIRDWTRQREQINSQKCKSALTVTTVGAGSVVKKVFDSSGC